MKECFVGGIKLELGTNLYGVDDIASIIKMSVFTMSPRDKNLTAINTVLVNSGESVSNVFMHEEYFKKLFHCSDSQKLNKRNVFLDLASAQAYAIAMIDESIASAEHQLDSLKKKRAHTISLCSRN